MAGARSVNVLREAIQVVHRNILCVFVYALISVLADGVRLGGDSLARLLLHVEAPDALPAAYYLFADVALSAVYALIQTLIFTWLGREIDKPLYKIAVPGEAMKRFFAMWLLFGLVSLTLFRLSLSQHTADNLELAQVLLLAFVMFEAFSIPVGACVMFRGSFEWRSLLDALSPLWRQFHAALGVLLVSLMQVLLVLGLIVWLAPYRALLLLVDVAAAYLACLVFAGVWLVCMSDRDSDDEPEYHF